MKLSGEIARIIRTPDTQSRLLALGADPIGSTPEQFLSFRKTEFTKVSKLISRIKTKDESKR